MQTTQLKKMILGSALLGLAACGGGSGSTVATGQGSGAGGDSTMTGLALTPVAEDVDDVCELAAIEGGITTSEQNNGVEGGPETADSRVGIFLKISANQNLDIVYSDYQQAYFVRAQDQDFRVLTQDGDDLGRGSASIVSPANDAQTKTMELHIHEIFADKDDKGYQLLIPEGSVTCADGSVTQTDYTVAFTVIGIPGQDTVSSAGGQTSSESTETEFTVTGEETSDCFPLNIEGNFGITDTGESADLGQTIYSQNGSEPTLALQILMNQRDTRFAWPVGWRDIDATKVSLTNSSGAKLDVEASVSEMAYEFAQSDYMNAAEIEFVGMPESKTTYTLTLLPGAMECVDDETSFSNTATYKAQIRIGQVTSCNTTESAGNVSSSCETD